MIDRWRWGVFDGSIKPDSYNKAWWELKAKYQGVASATPRGAIVYIHPFAEELNRSRHVVALQARAFAEAGYAVLPVKTTIHKSNDHDHDLAFARRRPCLFPAFPADDRLL